MQEIDKVGLIYIKDGKLLKTRSKGKDKFYLPGGKREAGETDSETLKREILEELSVSIVDDSIKYYGTFRANADGKSEDVFVKTTCYIAEIIGEIKPASEIEEIAWMGYEDIEKLSAVGKLIMQQLFKDGLVK